MHLRWDEAGVIGTNAIVGGGVPLANGAAWSLKRDGESKVAFSCFGDGSCHIGNVLESLNPKVYCTAFTAETSRTQYVAQLPQAMHSSGSICQT